MESWVGKWVRVRDGQGDLDARDGFEAVVHRDGGEFVLFVDGAGDNRYWDKDRLELVGAKPPAPDPDVVNHPRGLDDLADGWKPWGGGLRCPVDPEALVAYRMRDSHPDSVITEPAGRLRWTHSVGLLRGSDIVAYRLASPEPDVVNHPPHYTAGEIECIDAIRAALTPEEFRGFCKGNVIKYAWRERHKGGDESLKKGAWYLSQAVSS